MKPSTVSRARPLTDPFADRASLICRTLLEKPGVKWTVRGLAEESGVAPMLGSDIIRQLERNHIVAVRRDGRRLQAHLRNPDALLARWTDRYRWDQNAMLPVALTGIGDADTLRRLSRGLHQRRWALTMNAGAWQRARYSPPELTHVYVECASPAELRAVAENAAWPADPSGRVILMRPKYTTSVWHGLQTFGGDVPVVSDLQLILDLWHYPVRGQEIAEQLWAPIRRRFPSS